MTVAVNYVVARSKTRVRIDFTEVLSVSSFSPAWFTVASLDSASATPTVLAAYATAGWVEAIELVLSVPMVEGSDYSVTVAAGFPSFFSTLPAPSVHQYRMPKAGVSATQGSLVPFDIFGRDAVWNGLDLVESADQDLTTITGRANAENAFRRRLVIEGLVWDKDYGLKARDVIDAPVVGASVIQGRVRQQAQLDDRLEAVRVEAIGDDFVKVNFQLFGDSASLTANVKTDG